MSRPHFHPPNAPADRGSSSTTDSGSPRSLAGMAPEFVGIEPDAGDVNDLDFDASMTSVIAANEAKNTTTRKKLAEGARGIKRALRAESSFFAHAYRGLLIAISALILGVSATGWCFLIVSAALVLITETFRCAISISLDLLAEPGDPKAIAIREIASGGLLFASISSACLTIMVLGERLGEVLGW